MAESRRQLANSPLTEVVYELRFPGNFAVTHGLADLQKRLMGEFPNLFVPPAEEGAATALKPFRFAMKDGSESVAVALNSFAFMNARYTVFKDFKTRFVELLESFHKSYKPAHYTRLGLRFVNLLPWIEPASTAQLHPWLNIGLTVAPPLAQSVAEFQGTALLTIGDARLRIVSGRVQQQRNIAERHQMLVDNFVFDFDCYVEGELPPERVVAFLDEAHDTIDAAFFASLSDAGRAALGGEV